MGTQWRVPSSTFDFLLQAGGRVETKITDNFHTANFQTHYERVHVCKKKHELSLEKKFSHLHIPTTFLCYCQCMCQKL